MVFFFFFCLFVCFFFLVFFFFWFLFVGFKVAADWCFAGQLRLCYWPWKLVVLTFGSKLNNRNHFLDSFQLASRHSTQKRNTAHTFLTGIQNMLVLIIRWVRFALCRTERKFMIFHHWSGLMVSLLARRSRPNGVMYVSPSSSWTL